jgi:hypothetical protein
VQATTYRGQVLDKADRNRLNKLQESHLCTRWLLDTEKARDGTNMPQLYSVPVEAIQENILVVEEEPGLRESWAGHPVHLACKGPTHTVVMIVSTYIQSIVTHEYL